MMSFRISRFHISQDKLVCEKPCRFRQVGKDIAKLCHDPDLLIELQVPHLKNRNQGIVKLSDRSPFTIGILLNSEFGEIGADIIYSVAIIRAFFANHHHVANVTDWLMFLIVMSVDPLRLTAADAVLFGWDWWLRGCWRCHSLDTDLF